MKTPISAALAASVALLLSGCAGGNASTSTAADDASPVSGGTLNLAFWPDNAAFSCVDPFQTYWIEHRTVIRNFADSLTDQDPKTGDLKPWLAKDWKVSADGLEYTFNLRDDVTFSDGTKFDAQAVKTSFDADKALLKDLPTAYGAVYIAGYESTEVVDADTAVVHFTTPNAGFLQATSTTNLAILAPASYHKTPEGRCLGDVVGSGPFVLDKYTPNETIKLSKRKGYAWGSALNKNTGEAHLDGVNISYVAEDSVRLGNLTSGAIDIAWPRNPFTDADQGMLKASNATVQSRSLPGPASNYYPNVTPGRPLADLAVRKAVQKAIDRSSYASTVFGTDYPVVEGAYNSTTPYFAAEKDKLGFDKAGAADLLDKAGWTLGDDGYRHKSGKKLTLVIPTLASSTGDVLLQDQLKKVGIEVKLAVVVQAERASVLAAGDYDLATTYYTRADPGVLQWILDADVAGSKSLATNSQSPTATAEVKRLFQAGISATDPAKRAATYAELQDYLLDQAIAFPIFERVQYAGVSDKVHGFRFTSESFLSLNDVWLDR